MISLAAVAVDCEGRMVTADSQIWLAIAAVYVLGVLVVALLQELVTVLLMPAAC